MQDKNGREYLKLADAKQGMIVELDDGFTCRRAGKAMLYHDGAKMGPHGIYFMCEEGSHYIDGQVDDGIHCIGIYPGLEPATQEQAA